MTDDEYTYIKVIADSIGYNVQKYPFAQKTKILNAIDKYLSDKDKYNFNLILNSIGIDLVTIDTIMYILSNIKNLNKEEYRIFVNNFYIPDNKEFEKMYKNIKTLDGLGSYYKVPDYIIVSKIFEITKYKTNGEKIKKYDF